ncbi:hypothetical protein M422DRAFT_268411 [Sphaerobolus stellatus SS14]|uniref:Uncharacterized protein n=1 Tax=Sphaerobolus stellatus (strain SS14) TaxID=990650 RepID=A0A0C9U6X8_SPHS4|nr:hypothetical protein M422DRAFT_268411 [Sphaerobolus stellatus SS14]
MQYLPGKRFIDCFEDLFAEKSANRSKSLRYSVAPLSNRSKTGLVTLKLERKDDHPEFLQAGAIEWFTHWTAK